jgi:alpha-D-ribose 1-methylphosphonate 5-triphosphate synthase subunit PhnG
MSSSSSANRSDVARRQRWLAALARTSVDDLEAAWSAVASAPEYSFLRRPEVGLTMVRGRAGGSGQRFNLGEMTVTRCTVRTAAGYVGTGYVAGRNPRHAELVAVFDALLQDPETRPEIEDSFLEPMVMAQAAAREERSREIAATRVEFFTLVRGEDP